MKIMLDAGHYGQRNQSPVTPEYYESVAMWRLCEYLSDALARYGFTVGRTREEQEADLAVTARGRKAAGYDLFISLHSNAANSESVDRVDVYGPIDMNGRVYELGSVLINAVSELMGVSKGSVKTRRSSSGDDEYYGVLRGARSVGCGAYYIIEHSFHTNRNASLWLLDDANLRALAEAEAAVIASFYGMVDGFEPGDVDMNGRLDSVDVMLIKRAYFGTLTLSDAQKRLADIDNSGNIDIFDYLLAKRKYFE